MKNLIPFSVDEAFIGQILTTLRVSEWRSCSWPPEPEFTPEIRWESCLEVQPFHVWC